jgi:tetratricopeptide (TPR) repeat protein
MTMNNGCIAIDRILSKLDEHLGKNDYSSAEKHLLYWLGEAERGCDNKTEILILNELMGLYRKLGRRDEALSMASSALSKTEALGIETQVGAATTFLNAATVYKAFGEPERSLPLFIKARAIYETELEASDARLGGLYNNMALTFVDLGRFGEAYELYKKAISIMEKQENGALEVAITHLNVASAKEAELGLLDAEEAISIQLERAKELLEANKKNDGYYAFVCEKCASVFGYYGYFLYENELKERARSIYEGA